MNLDAAIADAERIEREDRAQAEREELDFLGMFLIRSNVEREGWVTDGVFAPREAREQIAAMLRTKQIAEHEGHDFEYRVYALRNSNPLPLPMNRFTRDGLRIFMLEGKVIFRIPLPPALDY